MFAIAERFKEYDMQSHLKLLRAYYRQRMRRKRANALGKQPPPWDEDMVLQWAALWRIPPFDTVYLQLPKGLPCPCGKSSVWNTHGGTTFPEGYIRCCGACGATWLVLEE